MRRSPLQRLVLLLVPALAAATMTAAAAPAATASETGTIAGTLTDNGAPVAGASVYLYATDDSYGDWAETDSNGRYTLSNVPAGEDAYLVSFQAAGHPEQYAFGKVNWDDADRISVVAGQRTTVDDALLPTGTISGRFTDSDGNGVYAWVRADGGNVSGGSTRTDSDGSYSLKVFPGSYRISFSYGENQQYAYGTTDHEQAEVFAVAAGQAVTVNDVKLQTGAIEGRVTDANGVPAADIEVQASGAGSGWTRTDESGDYRLDDLLPGTYKVDFSVPDGGRQYAHQSRTWHEATRFEVVGGETTRLDEQLLPTGSVAGRFVDRTGAGMANVQVSVSAVGYDDQGWASTDANGDFHVAGLFTGEYTVHFSKWGAIDQYAYGQVHAAQAERITVAAGQTSTVNDTALPVGDVRITARDAVTGAAVTDFWVNVKDWSGSSADGAVTITGLPVGTYPVSAGGDGYAFNDDAASVTVVAGAQVEVELSLRPLGRITTTVTDRATGAPAAGICVFPVREKSFNFPDGCRFRSDSQGEVTITVNDPDRYRLFALPDRSSPYGAQWVGTTGGTGSELAAKLLTVEAGATVAAPTVRLDRKGVVTGTVTTADGAPVRNGTVSIVGPDIGAGADLRYARVAADGTYRIDWLGPYRWPLLFKAEAYPYQWSGGLGNRYLGRTVAVQAGTTSTFDHTLRAGADLTVTVPSVTSGRIVVHNAVTGDRIGVVDGLVSTGVTLQVARPQFVRISCYCGDGMRWYGGDDFDSASPVLITGIGTKEIVFPAG